MKLSIFDKHQEFNPAFEAFCKQNCLQQVLHYYGVEDSYKYMDTSLNMFLYKLEGTENDYDAELRDSLLHEEYLEKLSRYEYEDVNPRDIWLKNKEILTKEKIPIIVSLDLYEMEYSKTFQIYHNNHSVILCGYEQENPILIDCYQWKFKGEVLLEQYLKARNSECPFDDSPFSGMPINNSWFVAESENWAGNIEELLKKTIEHTLSGYYENTGTDKEKFYGIEAFHKLKELFFMMREGQSDERILFLKYVRKLGLNIYAQLILLRYYIKQSSEKLNLSEAKVLLDELSYGITMWNSFSVLIVKGLYNTSDALYDKIEKRFSDSIEVEESRYQNLKNFNKIL